MRSALGDPNLFGSILAGETWETWRVILIAALGEELTRAERQIFKSLTGRECEPGEIVEELWAIVGRRGGKTRAVAVLAAFFAALVDWRDVLAPGERGVVPVMAASMAQAGKVLEYVRGIFADAPVLRQAVGGSTADTISLTTVDIQVRPASFRTIRGLTAVAAIGDEVAYWYNENSANPDREILDAVRPALATTGGPLIVISSPYARKGEVFATYRRDYGPAGDPRILVAKAPSRVMNPSLPQGVVDRAYARDPAVAAAEWGAEFRTDVESFVAREAVEACVVSGVRERPPLSGARYVGFTDPSGGSADSMTIAVAHRERGVAVLDAIRERKPPFSPEAVVAEFADLLKRYGIGTVEGDRYAGEWPRERFRVHGITYRVAERVRSDLYRDLLPEINSGSVELLDEPRLVAQIAGLERRTSRGGRDSIDHAPGGHDDLANAAAGALASVSSRGGGSILHLL